MLLIFKLKTIDGGMKLICNVVSVLGTQHSIAILNTPYSLLDQILSI